MQRWSRRQAEAAIDAERRTVAWALQAAEEREQRLQELVVERNSGEICLGSQPLLSGTSADARWCPQSDLHVEAEAREAAARDRRMNGLSVADLRIALRLFVVES
mmetsp:Transcript_105039/g.186085  ORF Transcript_105039/g.186085 Transcript_105039/m.186085 type:complete len:105 (-) Transcript_105039:14-328(-)